MTTLARNRAGDVGSRVEDYLDDKIQTVTDLENVNELLAKVKEQQSLLKQQLEEAKSATVSARNVSDEHARNLRQRAEAFQQAQVDIDDRLKTTTQSEVSDEAVKIFESRMTKLTRLEIAEGYVETLKEIEGLTSSARKNLKSNAKDALATYGQLRSLLQGLRNAQPAAEGAAPHLVDHVERSANALYSDLRSSLESTFQTTLERMAWPKKELKLLGTVVQDWTEQAGYLLDLQAPGLQTTSLEASMTTSPDPVMLLPLQIMVKPLAQRFQYHFYGERPTNRLDKPEYFFSHALDLVEQHSPFMTRLLQPILDERMRTHRELEAIYPDAISSFISSLLPMVSAKCLSLLQQIYNQPQLLSHFIHEIMSFDSTLRDSWGYTPVPGVYMDWNGLTWEMLITHNYFNAWLQVEKDFALNRYKKIRDSPESSNIEYDGIETGRSKPMKGAIRVNDLLETITDRYRGLLSFSQKVRFLMDVQITIFDDYHTYLEGPLQFIRFNSSTAGQITMGQREDETGGLRGLESLTKVYGSAEYLERKMSDWSEDLFFLELWEELQDRARRNTRGGSIGRNLTIEEVAAKTSSTIKQTNDLDESEGGALFDETAASYRRLREYSEGLIVQLIEKSIGTAFLPLNNTKAWASISSSTAASSLTTSSVLDTLINTLSTLLDFLAKVVGPIPLRRITRQVCAILQRRLLDDVVLRGTFSAAAAAELRRDVQAIQEAINNSIKMPDEAQRHMRKVDEALKLLNLPVKGSPDPNSLSTRDAEQNNDVDDWGFTEEGETPDEPQEQITKRTTTNITEHDNSNDNDDDDGDGDGETNDDRWDLWAAEKEIFASNESARQALADMQIDFLSEAEARQLISSRIEIKS